MLLIRTGWLYLLLGSTWAASSPPTVDVSECSLVFRYKNVYYSGCTDTDMSGTPWCLLKKPMDGHPWGYCDMSTFSNYYADEDGERRDCDDSSPVKSAGNSYGCYSTNDQKSYMCMSEGKELSCLLSLPGRNSEIRKPISDKSTPTDKSSTEKTSKSSKFSKSNNPNTKPTDDAKDVLSLQIVLISSLACGLLVLLGVVFVAVRRARKTVSYKDKEPRPSFPPPPTEHPNQAVTSPDVSTLNPEFPSNFNTLNSSSPNPTDNPSEYLVVSTYAPTLSDELVIQPGDRVVVYKMYDDGWAQGVNLTRGGARGVFPRHCIDPHFKPNQSPISEEGGPIPVSKRTSSNFINGQP